MDPDVVELVAYFTSRLHRLAEPETVADIVLITLALADSRGLSDLATGQLVRLMMGVGPELGPPLGMAALAEARTAGRL